MAIHYLVYDIIVDILDWDIIIWILILVTSALIEFWSLFIE